MKMPWGKFKGEDIGDIPSDYLKWLAENCEQDHIATKADEEYQWREDNNSHKWED
jgi:hypothetical protein